VPGRAEVQPAFLEHSRRGEGDGVHVREAGEHGDDVDPAIAEVVLGGRDGEDHDGEQAAEDQRRLQLRRVALLRKLLPVSGASKPQHHAQHDRRDQHGGDRRGQGGDVLRRHHRKLDQHAAIHHRRRQHDHQHRRVMQRLVVRGTTRSRHGGCRARDQPSDDSAEHRAGALAHQLVRHVPAQAHRDHQHHHQPDLARVEHVERTVRFIREHRKNDERDECELHDRADVSVADPRGQAVQRRLEMKQDGDAGAHGDGRRARQLIVSEPGARKKHHDDGDFRRDARAVLAVAHQRHVAHEHRGDYAEQRCGDDPPAKLHREHRRHRSRQRDQRECPESREARFLALALQTDEKTQPERDAKIGERGREVHHSQRNGGQGHALIGRERRKVSKDVLWGA
jgi:hypothetical protein